MRITIRLSQPEDYQALTDIYNAQNEPHHLLTENELRSADERAHERNYFRRLSALVDGEVVGTAQFGERPSDNAPGKFWGWFFVRPDYCNEGVDTALWDEALSLLSGRHPRSLWTCIREDFVPAAGYLEERSYQEQFRSWGANLDLERFNPDRFERYTAAFNSRGIQLRTYHQLGGDSRRDEKLLALQAEIEEEAPHFEPIIPRNHPNISHPDMLLDSFFVAVHEDDYVGMASLTKPGRFPTVPGSGLTGVRREFRNQGIGTALKAHTAAWAKQQGYSEVNAGGAGANAPMLVVNRRIGFDVEPAWITFAKFL